MAALRFGVCCGLARQITHLLRTSLAKDTLDGAIAIFGVRYYRGSHRDTNRRERNNLAKVRKRQGIKPRVFDKWQFIRENYDKELYAFKHRLHLQFHDDDNLLTALTHESYKPPEAPDGSPQLCQHNAKFALLGFNVTSQYITEYLCQTYPVLPFTGIRCLHDFLVSRENISKVSELISLPELIRLEPDLESVNSEKHLSYRSEDIVCDAFFALIGAISTDQGSEEAQSFVHDFVATQLRGKELHNLVKFGNPQTVLENILLARGEQKPVARVIQESGRKTHLPAIMVGVFSGDKMIADAGSSSIAQATREAMNAAVMKLVQEQMRSEQFLSVAGSRTKQGDHQDTHKLINTSSDNH